MSKSDVYVPTTNGPGLKLPGAFVPTINGPGLKLPGAFDGQC